MVSQVAPVDKLSLALTILLAAVFLQEPLTLKTALGALLIIAETLVLVAEACLPDRAIPATKPPRL